MHDDIKYLLVSVRFLYFCYLILYNGRCKRCKRRAMLGVDEFATEV